MNHASVINKDLSDCFFLQFFFFIIIKDTFLSVDTSFKVFDGKWLSASILSIPFMRVTLCKTSFQVIAIYIAYQRHNLSLFNVVKC